MSDPLAEWERELLDRQERERLAAEAQRAVRRARLGPMPPEFEPLAVYNAERWRGLVHTAEYDAVMAQLQCRFNEWAGL